MSVSATRRVRALELVYECLEARLQRALLLSVASQTPCAAAAIAAPSSVASANAALSGAPPIPAVSNPPPSTSLVPPPSAPPATPLYTHASPSTIVTSPSGSPTANVAAAAQPERSTKAVRVTIPHFLNERHPKLQDFDSDPLRFLETLRQSSAVAHDDVRTLVIGPHARRTLLFRTFAQAPSPAPPGLQALLSGAGIPLSK